MPSIKIIRSALAELPKGPPIVAAFAGGTTGIGSYGAKALATAYASEGHKLRAYIIGRNASRAEEVISECRRVSPGSDWRFVQTTDLALMSEVDRCCADIIRQENDAPFLNGPPRLDLLYMTYCCPIFKAPTITKEGLDAFISMTYYSRIRFILQLTSLLTSSPLAGHAVSVYAGGFEEVAPGEMPIGCPPQSTYGVASVRKYSTFMKTFIFEQLAEEHAGKLRLTHIFPGLVDGPGFFSPDMPLWFRIVWTLIRPLAGLFGTSSEVSGQVLVYLATQRYASRGRFKDTSEQINEVGLARSTLGELGGGAYGAGQRGDTQNGFIYEKVRKEGMRQQVWEHTMEVFRKIDEKDNAAVEEP